MAIVSLETRQDSLPSNKTVISVDYLISTDGTFSDDSLVVKDIKDNVNLKYKEFELDFNTYDIYYGKVVLNFNSDGSDNYADRPVIITRDGDGFSHNNSIIVTPKLTLNSDMFNCALGGFTVNSSEFVLFMGTGSHKFTDWVIKDTAGDVVWSRKTDKFNLTSIRIPNDVLKVNRHYLLEAVYVASSNQRSNTGKVLIKTMGKSLKSDIIAAGDKRPTSEEYISLQESYEDLLELTVNTLALGGSL